MLRVSRLRGSNVCVSFAQTRRPLAWTRTRTYILLLENAAEQETRVQKVPAETLRLILLPVKVKKERRGKERRRGRIAVWKRGRERGWRKYEGKRQCHKAWLCPFMVMTNSRGRGGGGGGWEQYEKTEREDEREERTEMQMGRGTIKEWKGRMKRRKEDGWRG